MYIFARLMLLTLIGLCLAASADNQPSVDSKTLWELFHPSWRPGSVFNRVNALTNDPDHRIESEFRIPLALSSRVAFWTAIYSQFSSQVKVIHDRRNPGIVYGYIDFTPLYHQYSTPKAQRLTAEIEVTIEENLAAAIKNLAGKNRFSPLNGLDRVQLRRLLARHHVSSSSALMELIPNLRSQSGQKDAFQAALQRSQNFLPLISQFFAEQGLPRGLARIPFVESSFNQHARSKCGAMGIWQFTPWTARALIHKLDKKMWVDPLSQTKAAAIMLAHYRKALPDWGTAITSYNSGIGRVHRLVHKNDLKNISDLLDLPEENGGLGFAGQNFFSEFLAANLVEAYKAELFNPAPLPNDNLVKPILKDANPSIACFKPHGKEAVVSVPSEANPQPTLAEASVAIDADVFIPWLKVKMGSVIAAIDKFSGDH